MTAFNSPRFQTRLLLHPSGIHLSRFSPSTAMRSERRKLQVVGREGSHPLPLACFVRPRRFRAFFSVVTSFSPIVASSISSTSESMLADVLHHAGNLFALNH